MLDVSHTTPGEVPMSTDTARPVRSIAPSECDADTDTDAECAVRYRERIEVLHRRYRRRACRNGLAANAVSQKRVETAQAQLADRKTATDTLVGKTAEADPAKAAIDLNLATTALQASAQGTASGTGVVGPISAVAPAKP